MKISDGKRLGLISLGCPKNTVDSERLLGELAADGWLFTSDMSDADCLVVNTCGFINDARLESEEAIAEICEIKKKNPNVILVATGCLPQRIPGVLKNLFPELDLVVGIADIHRVPELIESLKRQDRITSGDFEIPGRSILSSANDPRLRLTSPWTAFMKIAEGCDHSCAFCTIPAIKGGYISRPINDLVNEARILADDGVEELILVSQDTTAYGSDIGTNLRNLLIELDKIENIRWIRLHYLYPGKISDSLLEIIANSSRILPYFDIPLQHVSPRILRAMNRLAPDIDSLDLVNRIRSRFSSHRFPACIRTTLMTGFPGETDDDAAMMLDFLEKARIDKLSVFRFSSESGTSAENLIETVPEHVAQSRLEQMMEAQHEISLEINEGWVGRNIEVLLESATEEGYRVGRSYRDSLEIDGIVIVGNVPDEIPDGTFIEARITGAMPYDLEAEFVSLTADSG
ncbi:MAG TPA: 30S ribosomal protein S12 methylthiotransferase RimO [Firmicutes bacterium]|nr:30S ribosomal protein S12 methylthiotransferase RimO [Bacillota bacterium]